MGFLSQKLLGASKGRVSLLCFFIFKNKLISVSTRKAATPGSKGNLGEKLHGVTDSLPVNAVSIFSMPSPKDPSERKENLTSPSGTGLAWLGSR